MMTSNLHALERAIRLAINATAATDNFAAARFVQYSHKAHAIERSLTKDEQGTAQVVFPELVALLDGVDSKPFPSADGFFKPGGVARARAYCDKRAEDCAALRKEIDVAFGGHGPQNGYTAVMYGQVHITYDRGDMYAWTVKENNTVTPARTEAQVLAYILARFW